MSKRFTDSRKWDDGWFLGLNNKNKLTWLYFLDKCDHAGIYKHAFSLEKCCLGSGLRWEEISLIFGDRIYRISDDKWFIPKFIEFQYGELNPANRVHLSVIDVLKKEGAYKGLTSPMQGAKDKDKDKDKISNDLINNDKDTNKSVIDTYPDKDKKNICFERVWSKYPMKVGKKAAYRHFIASVVTEEDQKKIEMAIDNYLKSERVKKGFIQNGSTWFNDWTGWMDPPKNEMPKIGIERFIINDDRRSYASVSR